MMRILVTGAAGFIGSALARRLIEEKYEVVTVDNLSTGKMQNIPKDCKSYIGNVFDSSIIGELKNYNFEAIFHIAGQSSGEISFDEPVYDLQTNAQSTLMLLNLAKETGCKKFIYTSSMSVYGDHKEEFVNEESYTSPKSFYAVGKLASENYMKIYSTFDIKCTVLRLFNVYGIGQNMENLKQGMLSIYLAQAIKNKHIVVKGSKDRFRDFVNVNDVVEAMVLALNSEKTNSNFEIYNVSNSKKYTVEELVYKIKNNLPYNVTVEYIKGTPGDQHGIYGDNTKIKNELNWQSQTNFDEGIAEMVKWAIQREEK
ncbi:GDP-mannose 4,6-dehydratase [Candidatus Galacturonibacter soehngenii]|nr:GDP-mannose 4,6-dehydratase [Candidatus Galacturonibacter soehngenii]